MNIEDISDSNERIRRIKKLLEKRNEPITDNEKRKAIIERIRNKEAERPLDDMINEKLASYEKFVIKEIGYDVMKKIRETKPISESNLFMFVSSFLRDSKIKIKYTDNFVYAICFFVTEKISKKYLVPDKQQNLEELFW